ncbi:MAG: hypothetical protein PHV30_09530 [Candidatus Margulisbacteria bacterium]|nr:hypothetical protein [Candidatus Margulisiibacteriota bacterium]
MKGGIMAGINEIQSLESKIVKDNVESDTFAEMLGLNKNPYVETKEEKEAAKLDEESQKAALETAREIEVYNQKLFNEHELQQKVDHHID